MNIVAKTSDKKLVGILTQERTLKRYLNVNLDIPQCVQDFEDTIHSNTDYKRFDFTRYDFDGHETPSSYTETPVKSETGKDKDYGSPALLGSIKGEDMKAGTVQESTTDQGPNTEATTL